jgi:hypothetical protein
VYIVTLCALRPDTYSNAPLVALGATVEALREPIAAGCRSRVELIVLPAPEQAAIAEPALRMNAPWTMDESARIGQPSVRSFSLSPGSLQRKYGAERAVRITGARRRRQSDSDKIEMAKRSIAAQLLGGLKPSYRKNDHRACRKRIED